MKRFQEEGLKQFNTQTANVADADVTEVHLAQAALSSDLINDRISKLSGLRRLSLVNCHVSDAQLGQLFTALRTSGAARSLRFLDLCDNKLTNFTGLAGDASGAAFPALVRLILANNKIASVGALGLSAQRFPSLRTLDVEDNECGGAAESADAHGAWALCPSLVVVNGKGRNGEHAHDPSDEDDDDDDDDDDDEEGEEDEEGGDGDTDDDSADNDYADENKFVASDDDEDEDADSVDGNDDSAASKEAAGQRRERDD